MTLVNVETGEIIEPLERTEAERLTTRIRLRLDTIADNYAAVMPLIREAIDRQAWAVLGYSGVSEYVSQCFGDALTQLPVVVRREVVAELSASGMSTRAIAPVVGASHMTVQNDLTTGVKTFTPEPSDDELAEVYGDVDEDQFEAALDAAKADGDMSHANVVSHIKPEVVTPNAAPVTGLDGKTYKRPRRVPRPAAERTLASIQSSAAKAAREAQALTPEQIRRVRAEADHVVVSLRNSIEVLQHLVNSLDNKESK